MKIKTLVYLSIWITFCISSNIQALSADKKSELSNTFKTFITSFTEPVLREGVKQYDENGVLQESLELKIYYANKVQYIMNKQRLAVLKHNGTILAGMAISAGVCSKFFPELVGPQLTLKIPTDKSGWAMWLVGGALNYLVVFPVIHHVTSKASSLIDKHLKKWVGGEGQWDFSLGNFIQNYTYFVESADNLHKEVSCLLSITDDTLRTDLIDVIQDKINIFLEELLYVDGYIYLAIHTYKKDGKFAALHAIEKGYKHYSDAKTHFITVSSQLIKDLKENKNNSSNLQEIIIHFAATIRNEMEIVRNRFNYLNLIIR